MNRSANSHPVPGLTACRTIVLAASVMTLASIEAGAAAPPEPAGTIVLFDGKSLDGWKKVGSFKAGEVRVEGGSIVLNVGGPMTAVVSNRKDLPTTNYELTFEARRTEGSDFFAAATFPVGPSFLTLVNGGWGGSVTGLSSINGADASENETNRFVKYQDGTWYKFRVQVTDAVVRCRLDDKEIIAVRHEGQQLKTRVEVRGCQPLGFASYRSAGGVRAVQVRPLTAAEVKACNDLE
jgi:hypothetical protein